MAICHGSGYTTQAKRDSTTKTAAFMIFLFMTFLLKPFDDFEVVTLRLRLVFKDHG